MRLAFIPRFARPCKSLRARHHVANVFDVIETEELFANIPFFFVRQTVFFYKLERFYLGFLLGFTGKE